uniref:Uncharacterized protein n=1 Tax=Panagrolaimus superbus TaxID=310955 RepID=A0A914YP60_9BILA
MNENARPGPGVIVALAGAPDRVVAVVGAGGDQEVHGDEQCAGNDFRQEQSDDDQHDVDADHHQRLAPHAQDEQVDGAEEEGEEVDVDLQAVAEGQRLPGLLETRLLGSAVLLEEVEAELPLRAEAGEVDCVH